MKSSRSMYSSRENGTMRDPVMRHVVRVVRRVQLLDLALRVVGQHDLERVHHAHHPRHPHVEIVADRVLIGRQLGPSVFRATPTASAESANGLGRHAAAPNPAIASACGDRPIRCTCPSFTSRSSFRLLSTV